jgi:acyl carrier protein
MDNLARLADIFREIFDDLSLQVTDDLSPASYELWDSVETVNLLMAIEREFGIQFSTAEVAGIKTFGTIRALVEKHTK